jgi:protein-tyrosine phosphatase
MAEMLDWPRGDAQMLLRRALEELAAGHLVVFPTETGYHVAASATHSSALAALGLVGKSQDAFIPVRHYQDALLWAPNMSAMAKRLCRRVWPGPVTLVLPTTGAQTPPPDVAVDSGGVRVRAVAYDAVFAILEQLKEPLVMAPLIAEATSPEQLVPALGDRVALILADPEPPPWNVSTVVLVAGDGWNVARAGPFDGSAIKRLLCTTILFVCTGNTCRSPLAEVLCKKLLAQRLGCAPEELPDRGFVVISAGLAAIMGIAATPEAVDAARECGADLAGHRSQPLTAELLDRADYVFTMTQGHLRALMPFCPEGGPQLSLLACDGGDIPDPIGAEAQVYRECSQRILKYLVDRLPEVHPA